MLRVVLVTFSLILVLPFSAAQAQEAVRVRPGEHDGYARLVFDMGKTPSYVASSPKPGELVLTFTGAAPKVDDSAFRSDPPENISSIKVLSTSPLTVALTLAPGTSTRDFSAGNRVIVDVYDAPGDTTPTKKTGEKKAAPAVEAKKPEPVKTAEIKKPEPKKEEPKPAPKVEPKKEEPKPEPKKEAAKAPVKETPIAIKNAKPATPAPVAEVAKEDLSKLQQTASTDSKTGTLSKPNIITLTSTKSTGLAVYERDNKVWMIADQEDLMLSPNVTGPNAREMMPPGAIPLEGGKIYTFPKIGGKSIQGQAGGLVWRVVIAPQDIYLDSIKPTREDDNGDEPGGGKVIWELQQPGRVYDVPDPISGRNLKVVTVGLAKYMAGEAQDFVEFETLLSPVGLVILPRVDDLTVEITRDAKVVVSRPGGLQLMPMKNIETAMSFREAESNKAGPKPAKAIPENRVFDFNTWQMGGLQVLEQNRNLVLSTLAGKDQTGQVEGLISLAQMHLANGLWAEASGFLDFASDQLPEIEQNPEYVALVGATHALGRVSDLAFEDLNNQSLGKFPEIGYWKAYALADLEDWQQAGEVLPENIEILAYYPEVLISRLGLVLAEVALRSGKLDQGEKILNLVEKHGGHLVFQQQAALDYLKGEAQRQRGKPDEAIKAWEPLTIGKDAMYRARAGLAITRLKYEKKQIKPDEAIDKLERLRFAWRGDELEALINYWLGKVYFDTGEYVKGLRIMRDASTFAADTDLGDRITAEMMETFTVLFTGDGLKKLSGPDAAALYDEFSPSIPKDEKGDLVGEKLADHLVEKELFERAILLLQAQLPRKQGIDAFRIGTKLAAIELLDGQSANAMKSLAKAKTALDALPEELKTPDRYQEISLLHARALSQERRPDQALAMLQDMPRSKSVNKLRADIAWRAGYWDDAAEALGDVIVDEDISVTRPLTEDHTNMIMRRSVALSLAGDRIGLANMRERYSDSMAQTPKARIFEVITRARQSGALADRDTLMSIVNEVDMFKEFLDTYKESAASTTPAVPATAPATPAAPATAAEPAPVTPPATQ